jgi:hypothetical protein
MRTIIGLQIVFSGEPREADGKETLEYSSTEGTVWETHGLGGFPERF